MIDADDISGDNRVTPDKVDIARTASLLLLLPKDATLKPSGRGRYMTNCPFHDDSNPSMSIAKCDDGKWRFRCFGCGEHGDTVQYLQRDKNMSFTEAVIDLYDKATRAAAKPAEVDYYDYVDERGTLLYQVVRYEPKGFRQRRPIGNGRWCWSLGDVRRVLYRLPHLAAAKPGSVVYYVEGEKDVQSLERHGMLAVTHAGGTGGWRDDYAMALWGMNVVIIPDDDEPGAKLAQRIAAAVTPFAAGVFVCNVPLGFKDATEYLESGRDVVSLIANTRRV